MNRVYRGTSKETHTSTGSRYCCVCKENSNKWSNVIIFVTNDSSVQQDMFHYSLTVYKHKQFLVYSFNNCCGLYKFVEYLQPRN